MINKKVKGFLAVLALSIFIPTSASAASYEVVKGDSLYTIAQLFDSSTSRLMQDNRLQSTVIHPGQRLEVPATVYTVKSGDSLYLIAKNQGIDLLSLRKANGKWDNIIYPGQQLLLPGTISPLSASSSAPSGVTAYTQYEADLLARLITAEANNQPYQAKVAVGAVVVNRVKDSRFPNTISDVIYERSAGYYQFTPVANGMIYKPASEEAKKAAHEALSGSDPTKGALYFFDDSATNKWLWSKPLALRSGNMVYVY
ncbi:MAG: LysM peptidoglycan-binding domain-containing protein [Clostridiaceae bacterium]|jgi:LysM repeat protein|nr:LysM peptidoglycan-binding domain-containing protein [Clostridiaceae bacterium]